MAQCFLALTAFLLFSAINLTGTWTGEIKDTEGGGAGAYLQLTQEGAHINGVTGASKEHSWPIKNAIFANDQLTFTATSTDPESGAQSKWIFDLKVDGDRMTGTAEGSREGHSWKLNVALTRQK
jgi:hypothetical protein